MKRLLLVVAFVLVAGCNRDANVGSLDAGFELPDAGELDGGDAGCGAGVACGAGCCAAGEACVDGACVACPIPCAERCCQATETCEQGRCVPACQAETDSEFCTRFDAACGDFTGLDDCGRERTAHCGDCGVHEECSPTSHQCQSTCEDATALCHRVGAECGALTSTDDCGEQRTVDCGDCPPATSTICNDLNMCVFCAPETDAVFCQRLDKDCNAVTAADNCGRSRTVDCGACAAPRQCTGDNLCTMPGAPANDDCSHAEEIVLVDGQGTALGDTSTATDSGSGSCGAMTDGADVVFKFAVASEKNAVITVRPDQDSGFVPLIYVRADCASTAFSNELGCDRQSSPGNASVITLAHLVAGTYYVWVDSPAGAQYGAFSVTVEATDPPPVPPNDGCSTPEELVFDPTTGTATASGDTRGAFDDFTGSCATNFSRFDGPDVVYWFTAANPMSVRAEVTGSGGLDPSVYLRATCGDATSERTCGLLAPSTGKALAAAPFLAPGTYYVIVDGISRSAGTFTLELTRGAPTTNDTCSNPEDLTFDATTGIASTTGDTTWVAPDYSGSCSSGWSRDLVYRFTLNATKDVVVVATPGSGSQLKPSLYVRSTCDQGSTEVGCTRANAVVPGRLELSRLAAGTWYLFVDGADMSTKGAFALTVTTTDPPRPAPGNDTCAAPEPLSFTNRKAVVTATTLGASNDYAGTCSSGYQPHTGPDLVYSFQLAAASAVVAKLTRDPADVGVMPALYLRSTCASSAPADEAACASPMASTAKLAIPNLAAGTWYLVVDSAYGAATGFTLEVQTLDLIQNDVCGGTPTPIVLDSTGQATLTGDTSLAQDDADGSCNGYTAKDLVYQLQITNPKTVTIVVTPDADSALRPTVYLRSQCADPTTDVQCQNSYDPSLPATLQIGRLAAGTYYVWVDGSTYNYDGGFTMQVSAIDPPFIPNDTCASVQALQLDAQNEAHLSGTTLGAGDDLRGGCQSMSDYGGDVVYSLQLSAPSMVVARVSRNATSPNYKPAIYIRSTCASALAADQLACATADAGADSATAAAASLAAGTYYLVVDGSNDGYFHLDVKVAAPLTNDSCSTPNAAQPLTFNGSTATASGDTSAAIDDQQGGCNPFGGRDIVYTFTLGAVMDVSIDVAPNIGSSLRPMIYLRRACEDPGTEIACVFNSSVTYTYLNVPKLGIGTYYLWVDGQGGSAGDFRLTVDATPVSVPPPPNDACSGVQSLLVDPVTHKATVTGDTTAAVDDYRGNCQYSYDPFDGGDLVYSLQLSGPSSVTARLIRDPRSSYNPALYIRSTCASGAAADEVGCVPGSMGTASLAFASLPQGTYYLVVDGFNDGAFTLEVTVEPPITNDNCGGANSATALTFDPATGVATLHGDTAMGSDDGSGTCWPGSSGRDLVYSFELASARGVKITVTPSTGSNLDPHVYLRSACDDPASEVLCGYSPWSTAPLTLQESRLPAGTWYVWVDGFDGTRGAFDLKVEQTAPAAAPANDTCSAPEALSIDPTTHKATVTATTVGATNDYTGTCASAGRFLATGGDRVYSFTLTADARVSARVTPATSSAQFAPAVYIRSTCASSDPADERACAVIDFNAPAGSASATPTAMARWLTPGTWYVIVDGLSARLDGQSGAEGDFTLEVETGPAVTNDTCAQPIALQFTRGVATVTDDTRLGTDSGDGCYFGMSGSDLVYSFTLATMQNVEATVGPAAGSTYVPYLYLRSVCDSDVDQLACQPGWGSTPVTVSVRRLTAGTYYVWVDSGAYGGDGAFTLTVTLTEPPPAPANDTCAAPQALTFDPITHVATASGTNTDAGDDYSGGCDTLNGPDLVYSFTLTGASSVTATVTNALGTGALRPGVYLRSSCASSDPADEAACAAGWSPMSTSALLGPGTWYVIVDSLDRTVGTFDLEVSATPLVAADSCINATELVLSSGLARASGDTSVARPDSEGSCASAGKDLVYFFTLPAVKTVEVTMTPTGTSSLQPTLRLERACADVGTEAACSPAPSAGAAAHLLVPRLSPGTWYLWADGVTITSTGAFDLVVSAIDPPVPPNDACPGAQTLAFDPVTAIATVPVVDTTYAVDSAFGTCGGTRTADVFFKFTTLATQKVTATVTRSALTPGFEPVVYLERVCGAFFASDEYTCATEHAGQAVAVVNALPAGTYWIAVDGLDATYGQASLEVALAPPAPGPANDSCATAAALTFTGTTVTATGSTVGAQTEASNSCSVGGSPDVVYSFTTTAEQKITVAVTPSGAGATSYQPAVALRRNCGSARTEVVCSAAGAAGAAASAEVKRAPAGTYFVWVSSAGSAASTGDYALQVTLAPPVGPANDTCAFAIPLAQGAAAVSGTTVDATDDSGATLPWWFASAPVAGPDVVYSFTPAADGTFTITVTPSGFDAVVWISETVCGPASNAANYADGAGSGGVETLAHAGTGGTTYFVFVDSATSAGSGTFTIDVQ